MWARTYGESGIKGVSICLGQPAAAAARRWLRPCCRGGSQPPLTAPAAAPQGH